MNLASVIGVVGGSGVLLGSVFLSLGGFGTFVDFKSLFIVVGGSTCAMFVVAPLKKIKKMLQITISKVIKGEKKDYEKLIAEILELAKAKRLGDAAFDSAMKKTDNQFLRDAASVLFWADTEVSADEFQDLLQQKVQTHIGDIKEIHNMYKTLGKFPPAFGMMGTVLGLIALLQSLGSPDAKSKIGPSMAIALITTIYGIAINNIFVIPLGEGVGKEIQNDLKDYNLVVEGIMLIQQKKPTKYIEEKLNSYLMPNQRGSKAA